MDISLEALVVGLFALLPGFFSASIRNMWGMNEPSTTATWAVSSILASLFLNALALLVFFGFQLVELDFDKSVQALGTQLSALSGRTIVFYLLILYALATTWGLVSGYFHRFAPQRLLFLSRLSPISPESSVFTQALVELYGSRENAALWGSGKMQVPWLKIVSKNGAIFGRMLYSTQHIDKNEPFEVFLNPVYYAQERQQMPWTDGGQLNFEGLYVRILPEQPVEVFSAGENWQPDFIDARDGPPAAR